MPPNDIQFARFYRDFEAKTGINFNLYKQDQLQRRMLNLVEARKLDNFEELTKVVLNDDDARTWFLDRLAINVTEVFRNPEHWETLESYLTSEFLPKKRALKIWSAGCSTGAEAYSLAAILNQLSPGVPHKIVGTDIDVAALDQAKKGELFGTEFRHVPTQYQKHFHSNERGAVVSEELKKYVSFHHHNLLGPAHGKDYDIIICRNVLIYFVEEAKESIYKGFIGALCPGGYLFLGGSERIFNAPELGFETPKPYFYRKPIEEIKWRNAS
jgi:chemotaxis protein methyltransferase CheR